MIKLYAFNLLRMEQEETESYLDFISQQRRDRIRHFRNPDDAKRSLCAELLIRKVAINQYGMKNKGISFDLTEFGKPFISSLPDFYFNISHSGQWVVCAVGNKEVGVDIQEIREIDLEIAKYSFTEKEYHELLNLEQDQRLGSFFTRWTRKESYLKAIGIGFLDKDIKTQIADQRIFFKTYNIDPGYCLSVCGFEKEFESKINFMDISQADFLG